MKVKHRRAIVLGAGASAAYSQSPTGMRMPLARTFFEVFDRLPQLRDPWVVLHGLFNYIEERKRREPVSYLCSGIDIEELHSEIHQAAISTLSSRMTLECIQNFKAHHELVFLFAFVINTIQNGPVSNIHARLAQTLTDHDGIITLNWDTLMDRALSEHTERRDLIPVGPPIRYARHPPRGACAVA